MTTLREALLLPLRARDGRIVGEVLLDPADHAWMSRWTWRLHATGYAVRGRRGPTGHYELVYMHRELLGLVLGNRQVCDHRNRNKLDCRRANLRVVAQGVHCTNRSGVAGKTSVHRGVHWHRGGAKWEAAVTIDGKKRYLGLYADEEVAAEVARAERERLFDTDCEGAAA